MLASIRALLIVVAPLFFAVGAVAQVDDICREFGETPTREANRQGRGVPFVYGRIVVKGASRDASRPRVTVTYSDARQPATRQPITESGNYCFKRLGNGGMLIVEINGIEAARKSVSDLGDVRQREDFEIIAPQAHPAPVPGVVSTRFAREPNERTSELYRQAAAAEAAKDLDRALDHVRQIVAIDPQDFVAWAKLGSLYLNLNLRGEAETALRRAVKVRPDYTPALLNLGTLLAVEQQIAAAVEIFKQAVVSDPSSARAYRLLGEAYLQNREGTLGLAALDEALRIDPVGMAECHLLKARLYDLAGAKNLASAEYKVFLTKVPAYSDRKTLEKYIRDNPE